MKKRIQRKQQQQQRHSRMFIYNGIQGKFGGKIVFETLVCLCDFARNKQYQTYRKQRVT